MLLLSLQLYGTSWCLYASASSLHGSQNSLKCMLGNLYHSRCLQVEKDVLAITTLYSLESTISERKAEILREKEGKPSWTEKLLLEEILLCSKIWEEADELCHTLEHNEDKSRAASEMADVLSHSMVLLAFKGVKMEDVLEVLRRRFSKLGIEEKKIGAKLGIEEKKSCQSQN